jgi:hypothetical protein
MFSMWRKAKIEGNSGKSRGWRDEAAPSKPGSDGSGRSNHNDDPDPLGAVQVVRARACPSGNHRQLCRLEVNDAEHG